MQLSLAAVRQRHCARPVICCSQAAQDHTSALVRQSLRQAVAVQIQASEFEEIETRLLRACMSSSSQSSLPAIYGQAASEETKRLRPLGRVVEVSWQCRQRPAV